MKFFKKDPFGESIQRMEETELFEIVTKEVMNEEVIAGIWGKAFADTEGDEQKAKALYIRYRVQDLKDRVIVATELGEQLNYQNQETAPNNHANTSRTQTRANSGSGQSRNEVRVSVVHCPKCKNEITIDTSGPSFISFVLYSRGTRFLFWILLGGIVYEALDFLVYAEGFTVNPFTFLKRLFWGYLRLDELGPGYAALQLVMYLVLLFSFYKPFFYDSYSII